MMKVTTHMLNDLKPPGQSELVVDLLDAMEELKYSHLPIVDEERHYLGLVCGDDLLDVPDENDPISKYARLLKPYAIKESGNMFEALRIIGEGNLSLLPVVDENDIFKGYISSVELLQDLGRELTFVEPGSVMVLRVPSRDYQLTQIAQIVESEDAKIIGFHLAIDQDTDQLLISLKINQIDLGRILRTFERYNYVIVEVFHQSIFDDSLQDRYQSFMKYLNT